MLISLKRCSSFLVSSRTRDSVFYVRRGLCVLDSSVRSVLKTSNPVTLACVGVGSVALKRVSARWSEVPFLYFNEAVSLKSH